MIDTLLLRACGPLNVTFRNALNRFISLVALLTTVPVPAGVKTVDALEVPDVKDESVDAAEESETADELDNDVEPAGSFVTDAA